MPRRAHFQATFPMFHYPVDLASARCGVTWASCGACIGAGSATCLACSGVGEGVLDETNRLIAVRRQYGAKTHFYALHSSQLTKTR